MDLELKTEITERKFVNRLDGEYSVLTSMEDDDLARTTKILKQRENSIRELISEYNIWVNEQNANNRNKTSANKETTSTDNSSTDFALIGIQHIQNREYAPAIRNFFQIS